MSFFWVDKALDELNAQEWESLCDGCGLCCLQKLEDEDDGSIYYTQITCKLLDPITCRCTKYAQRKKEVSDCLKLTAQQATEFHWLPSTCAYRLLSEGKGLPRWHYLICNDKMAVHRERISLSGRQFNEQQVAEEDWEDHIIFRISN
ncbi:UNVERIFIED_CONTAM: hypothetical protein GTU68_002582 [Idotea baltica]|nr:hypothetical protein [Idotea baltica]